jgi:hypothetical protein
MGEYFTVEGKTADTNCIGTWVEPRVGPDALEERWTSSPASNQTAIRQSSSP